MAEIKATPATGALGLFNQRTIHGFVPSADSYAPAVRVQEMGQQLFRSLGLTDPSDNDIWDAMVVGLINQQLANDPGVTRWSALLDARWISGPTVSASRPTPRRRTGGQPNHGARVVGPWPQGAPHEHRHHDLARSRRYLVRLAEPVVSTIAEVNIEWALRELEKFQHMLDYRDRPGMHAATNVGTDDEIAAQRVVVERIFARAIGPRPMVPMGGNDPLRPDRDWTIRCIETIRREAEIRETSAKMRRT